MAITIQRGVDIPIYKPSVNAELQELRSAVQKLEVGDSFEFRRTQQNHVYATARVLGIRVTIRDLGQGAARVWRIQ